MNFNWLIEHIKQGIHTIVTNEPEHEILVLMASQSMYAQLSSGARSNIWCELSSTSLLCA